MMKNTHETYGGLSIALHWITAVVIFGLLAAGLIMTDMDSSPQKWQVYGLHKAIGVLFLGVVLVRLVWRITNPVPHLPQDMPFWMHGADRLMVFVLYGVMLIMPISGIAMSYFGGHPIDVFGLVTIPGKSTPDPLGRTAKEIHEMASNILMILVGGHIAVALYHHFVRKDFVLKRMMGKK